MSNNGDAYNSERGKLKTGDVLLFSGKGGISDWIKWVSGSSYSHVGLVVVIQPGDMVCVWESTTLANVPDVDSGKLIKGVQLVPLSDRLQKYNGSVYVRKLNNPLTEDHLVNLWNFRKQVSGRSYEQDKLDLLRTMWAPYKGKEDLSSLFCSELTAESCQKMPILEDTDAGGMPSDKYRPDHFSMDHDLKLLDGYEWGAEIRLK